MTRIFSMGKRLPVEAPPPPTRGRVGWGKRAMIAAHRGAASPSLALPRVGGGDSRMGGEASRHLFQALQRGGEVEAAVVERAAGDDADDAATIGARRRGDLEQRVDVRKGGDAAGG